MALDVKKAFNVANWNRIKWAMAVIDVSRYLSSLIENYFAERTGRYETDGSAIAVLTKVLWKFGGPKHWWVLLAEMV